MDRSSPATRVATPIPGEKLNALEQALSFPTTVVAELGREDDILANASTARKLALMTMFSAAQFLDVFNNRYVPCPLLSPPPSSLTLSLQRTISRNSRHLRGAIIRAFRDSVGS
jgi:hypothetical protein